MVNKYFNFFLYFFLFSFILLFNYLIGLDRESSVILFHMLHKSWSRSHLYETPLVNLNYPILSSRNSIQQYLEWMTDPIILRSSCDDIIRGVHDTVTPIPPRDNQTNKNKTTHSNTNTTTTTTTTTTLSTTLNPTTDNNTTTQNNDNNNIDNNNTNNPSNYRLFPPISILNLESNSIGWMGISILSTCLNVSLSFIR